jgi:hypothetical protein
MTGKLIGSKESQARTGRVESPPCYADRWDCGNREMGASYVVFMMFTSISMWLLEVELSGINWN